MSYFLVSRLYTKLAHLLISTSIALLIVLQHLKTQGETREAMKSLANSIQVLAGQLKELDEVPTSDQLRSIMCEFPEILQEVVDFIWRWLKSWMCMYQYIEMYP